MRPIGVVETDVADAHIAHQRRKMISEIRIFEEYAEGLTGLTDYSHIIVLFWMHRAEGSANLLIHPRGNSELPLTGVLASRGRGHPNPIGFAVVDLINRTGNRLKVRRLDAYDGTPIIDIKPYDRYDMYTELRMPQWLNNRFTRHQSENPQSGG